MTHLYLIRHAESILAHNGHVIDIMKEDRLTPEGIKQAERLRDRLAATGEIKADALLASTFPRASQTAEIIAPALGLPVILDDDLQEMRPGNSGGMYWDEYIEKHGRPDRSEEHTSELQSHVNLVCRLLLEKKKKKNRQNHMQINQYIN